MVRDGGTLGNRAQCVAHLDGTVTWHTAQIAGGVAMEVDGLASNSETMQAILGHIRESTSHSPAVYVHCWGGIGRTGTVVGCWLRECGHDPEAALTHVQHLYASHMAKVRIHPESPQTPTQKDYIRNWMNGH